MRSSLQSVIAQCHLKAIEIQLGRNLDTDSKTIHRFPPVLSILSLLLLKEKSEMTS